MDMNSGAAITAQLSSRTVAPFAYTAPSEAENAVRVDQLSAQERGKLLEGWTAQLAQYFASLMLGGMVGI